MTVAERRSRHFSANFKIQKVREIEKGLTRVSEISKQYEVSVTNIYRWINKFGSMKSKKERMSLQSNKLLLQDCPNISPILFQKREL